MEDGRPARLTPTPRGSYHSHTQLTINLTVTSGFPARAISVLSRSFSAFLNVRRRFTSETWTSKKFQLDAAGRTE
jgi:hypothetical protein